MITILGKLRHRVIVGLPVLALLIGGLTGTPTAHAAVGTFSQTADITIDDGSIASPYPSELVVSGLPKGVFEVQPTLTGFSHASPDDVDLLLVAPYGGRSTFMSDVGGNNPASNLDLTFRDDAATDLPDSGQLVSGTYRITNPEPFDPFPSPAPDPTGPDTLRWSFQFGDPNGSWKLYVVDDNANLVGGSIDGWSLRITTVDMPPSPTIDGPPSGTADADGTVALTGIATATNPIPTVTVYDGAAVVAISTPFNDRWNATVGGLSEGGHVFTARSTDFYGNVTPPSAPVTVTVDRAAPTAQVRIDRNAARTSRRLVSLGLTAADPSPSSGVTQMRFSNDGITFSGWEPFASTKHWPLPGSANGTRTVWAQVADNAGNASTTTSDSIVLDTVRPKVTSVKPARRATGIRVGKNITAHLSETLAPGTVTKTNVRLVRAGTTPSIRAVIRYNTHQHRITINPRNHLSHDVTYRVTIGIGVTDLAGNNLDQKPKKRGSQAKSWKFTTR